MSGDDAADDGLVPISEPILPHQWDALEEISRRTGVDRGAVLRRLLDLGLATERARDPDDRA